MERHAYTRLTLALDIVGRITEGPLRGFHELATIKQQIDLHDTISIEPASEMILECNDAMVPLDQRNICWKAVSLVHSKFAIDQPVHIVIEKRIPVMGGLAGGSANAATTLQILNELWKLQLSTGQLMELGRNLGMDVPFYFLGGTAFDSEAGGICTRIPTDIRFTFILALPEFGVSTLDAYQGINYEQIGRKYPLTERMHWYIAANDRSSVLTCIHNDFELTVFKRYPRLREIKHELVAAGCDAAVLSGSGSTVLGITHSEEHARAIQSSLSCRSIVTATL